MAAPGLHSILAKTGKSCARIAVLLSLPLLALLGCQSMLIYFPRPYSEGTLARARALGVTPVTFQTEEGRQVAHLLPARDPSVRGGGVLWIITAGNGSLALDYLHDALCWQEAHPAASFLFLDYPGYGGCQGSPDPESITRSIDAAHARLVESHGIDHIGHLGCFGHSLGAAAALIAAERLEADRIVLVSPFTSMADMAEKQLGKWARLILRHHFDNRARMQALSGRKDVEVIIFHGEVDHLVPARMSQELAQSFPHTIASLHFVPGAGHNDVLAKAPEPIAREISRPFRP